MATKRRWTVNKVVITDAQYDALSFAIRVFSDDDSPDVNRDAMTLSRLQRKLRPQ